MPPRSGVRVQRIFPEKRHGTFPLAQPLSPFSVVVTMTPFEFEREVRDQVERILAKESIPFVRNVGKNESQGDEDDVEPPERVTTRVDVEPITVNSPAISLDVDYYAKIVSLRVKSFAKTCPRDQRVEFYRLRGALQTFRGGFVLHYALFVATRPLVSKYKKELS
jgi:hypothetical protein